MSLWKARVDCYRKGVRHPMIRRFILEAPDSMGAWDAAQKHADSTASGAHEWIAFEVREVAPLKLPLEI